LRSCKNLFKIVDVLETDIRFPDDFFSLRLEVFQSVTNEKLFRTRAWRTESYDLTPAFSNENSDNETATATVLMDWSTVFQSDLFVVKECESKDEYLEYLDSQLDLLLKRFFR
jgi:hypothetical protein